MGQLNTAIIEDILSGYGSMGSALKIAQLAVGSTGHTLTVAAEKGESGKKIGHLLFICEDLMGMPLVTLQLIHTTVKESQEVTKSNCHKTSKKSLKMTYHLSTYMFIDPNYIEKFGDDFKLTPEYEELIEELAGYIDEEEEPA